MHTLFVYGTLMSGEASAERLRGAERLGPARTVPRFTLYRVDWYPAMADGGETAVVGEVYRVPPALMGALDAYEGPEYRRVVVELSEGPVVRAEAYVMPAGSTGGLRVMPSGDWRRREARGGLRPASACHLGGGRR